ncbi:MAG: Mur ligase family protein, partial [Verrucomicrobiota bacterium]
MNKSSSERSHSSSSPQQSFASTQRYLFALKNRGSKYGIDRMRRFAQALGHPQRKFPSIHVAGTNGKGSVCAMLEALYRENGYRTGLYTSPHLVHLGERVQINREMLIDQAIIDMIQHLKPIAEAISAGDSDEHPSFFEFMTAAAFLRFAESKVDIALIETGLGGRLDATNVLDPELSIITSISLDHTELLGDAIDKIAREKGGIIKPGKPVLIGKLASEAEKAIRQIADERGSEVFSIKERFAKPEELPETNLAGSFQRWNAGVALYASEILSKRFPITTHDGLQNVDWAGRWQRVEIKDRTLILDATHNPEGAEMLEENLQRLVGEIGKKPVIVAGTLGED